MVIYVNTFVNSDVNKIDICKDRFEMFGTAKPIKWIIHARFLRHKSKYLTPACYAQSGVIGKKDKCGNSQRVLLVNMPDQRKPEYVARTVHPPPLANHKGSVLYLFHGIICSFYCRLVPFACDLSACTSFNPTYNIASPLEFLLHSMRPCYITKSSVSISGGFPVDFQMLYRLQ